MREKMLNKLLQTIDFMRSHEIPRSVLGWQCQFWQWQRQIGSDKESLKGSVDYGSDDARGRSWPTFDYQL